MEQRGWAASRNHSASSERVYKHINIIQGQMDGLETCSFPLNNKKSRISQRWLVNCLSSQASLVVVASVDNVTITAPLWSLILLFAHLLFLLHFILLFNDKLKPSREWFMPLISDSGLVYLVPKTSRTFYRRLRGKTSVSRYSTCAVSPYDTGFTYANIYTPLYSKI